MAAAPLYDGRMRFRRTACILAMLLGCRPFGSSPVEETADGGATDAPADGAVQASGPPASCKELLERDAARRGVDGVHEIDPDGPGGAPPFQVFCDMTLDGGGWTLVGRSAPGPNPSPPPFGWRFATGSVKDATRPYSFDVGAARLAFSEVLFADAERTLAYKFSVPSDFLTAHAAGLMPTNSVTRVLGDCVPSDGEPTMFRFAGATSLTDVFFLRDIDDLGQHRGLRAVGFDLAYDNCDQGGLLDGRQGMVLVR